MKNITNLISKSLRSIDTDELKDIISENIRPAHQDCNSNDNCNWNCVSSLLVVIGEITLPFQSNGSLLTLDGKVVGSKLIAQEFKSDKFFHSRPAANSTSGVDPHITPEDAFSQVPRIRGQLDSKQTL